MYAVLSFFVPGLGQLAKGQILNALVWFVFVVMAYAMAGITMGIGLVVAVPLHLLCIVGASRPTKDQLLMRKALAKMADK